MASQKPFSARRLQAHGLSSVRVTLPRAEIDEHDVVRGEDVGGEYDGETDTLLIHLESDASDYDYELALGPVGEATGVTIPSGIRHRHGLEVGDFVEVEPDVTDDGTIAVSL